MKQPWESSISQYRSVLIQGGDACFKYPALLKPVLSAIRHTKMMALVKNASPECEWPAFIWEPKVSERVGLIHRKV